MWLRATLLLPALPRIGPTPRTLQTCFCSWAGELGTTGDSSVDSQTIAAPAMTGSSTPPQP
eukprot:283631-Lingulodinium_polyedra.AAC.1